MAVLVLEWSVAPEIELDWVGPSGDTVSRASTAPTAVAAVVGPPGPEGPEGPAGAASADAGNQLTTGSDGGLYMGPPQLETAQW